MTLLEQVADIGKLTEAWNRLYAGKSDDVREHSHGIDDESLAEFAKNAKENIQTISKQLLKRKYKLLPLSGFSKSKNNGKFRLITAPCVRDRIVHAAILAVIQDYFPEIRNGSSYCLPRTKNKTEKVNFIDAFRMLVKKVREGNKYVFESDIESFFDKIVKRKLFVSITSALPDSSLNKLLRKIVYYKVGNIQDFEKMITQEKIKKPHLRVGLSQGSPLSPLFANIYLNNFDNKMIKKFGNRFIRYVDDFIVLCFSSNETNEALKLAAGLLKDDALTLPPVLVNATSKTRTSIDLSKGDKFVFLGIEVSKNGLRPNFSDGELKQHIDKKCFTPKTIKMILASKKKPATNEAKAIMINARIQSKFGVYGYFHTNNTISTLNTFILEKAKRAKLTVKIIEAKKKGMPIISQKEWQAYFI